MKRQIRPVYMVYPGLYPLLMFNYWTSRIDIPVTALLISDFDIKHKGKRLNLLEVILGLSDQAGWQYMIFMLGIAKFAQPIVSIWNFFRVIGGKKVKIKTFEEIAKERGIPVFRTKDFNSPACRTFIKNVNANLIVSAYNNQILKRETFRVPELGAINVHPGLLPNFRGLDGPFQAMYYGVKKVGITIHRTDAKIDTGNLIRREPVVIRKDDTLFSCSTRLWMHGAKVLGQVLKDLENGTMNETKQDPKEIKYPYESFPSKKQINEFLKRGQKLICWRDIVNTFKD